MSHPVEERVGHRSERRPTVHLAAHHSKVMVKVVKVVN